VGNRAIEEVLDFGIPRLIMDVSPAVRCGRAVIPNALGGEISEVVLERAIDDRPV
jgi:hypothetical protein